MVPRKILVLGGSGFVGRAFLSHWTARQGAGQQVIVPSRRSAAARRALSVLPGVTVVEADVLDTPTLEQLVAGCDAVVNLVAILHGHRRAFQRLHVELPEHLGRACATARVPHLLHVSALGVPDRPAEAPSDYLRSKAEGEAALRAAVIGSRTALSLLRPSVIFGVEDRFLNLFARLQAVLPVMAVAGAQARFQPVWVGDVAEAMARCLTGETGTVPAPRPGRSLCVECAGPREWTLGALVRAAGVWSGHPRPLLPLPLWVGAFQAALFGLLPGEPLMSADNLRSMRVANVATPGHPGLADLLGRPATEVEDIMASHLAGG